ncbi:MAG: DUF3887 domain-containing protein [Armatimonadetes bacterium]|nr:DUF3887 domain-containing protein [Armatimonadota bacterium]NIM24323.1 DUF3887 domain-containing protein [Armatimonadota bacterium]NIM68192.1 DUF3887 domain-containing protein [Armatimonadota bacterium]NIM76652.1 DUF3887 domain-containing protein [Armatimonadota bacterium]NIN06397.1 DUF3887 domain-containing protein [Armatimonadota bacterium]
MTKYLFIALTLLALCVALTSCSKEEEEPPLATELIEPAQQFMAQLAARDFSTAVESFDENLKEQMPPDKLDEAWRTITKNLGAYLRQVRTEVTRENGRDVVYITIQFEKGSSEVQIIFDEEKRISEVWFGPPPKLI